MFQFDIVIILTSDMCLTSSQFDHNYRSIEIVTKILMVRTGFLVQNMMNVDL